MAMLLFRRPGAAFRQAVPFFSVPSFGEALRFTRSWSGQLNTLLPLITS